MIKITGECSTPDWNEFLDHCQEASIYHTPQWKKFIDETFNYKPHYIFAKDSNGIVVGMLPLYYVKSILTGKRLSSTPFSHVCGYIGKPEAAGEVMNEAIRLYGSLNPDYIEVKNQVDMSSFQRVNSFSTYVLELSSDIEATWKKLDKGSVRWAIKKSEKSGIKVDLAKEPEAIKKYYELNVLTKRELGVPGHTLKFFENMFKYLGDFLRLYLVEYEGERIAGGIFELYKDTVFYGYGAADSRHVKLYPYNAFIWESIKDATKAGYKHFDFGRTSYDNEGLTGFKRRWGTTETKLCYSYYPHTPNLLSNNRRSRKYQLYTGVIRNLPVPAYKKMCDYTFEHFG